MIFFSIISGIIVILANQPTLGAMWLLGVVSAIFWRRSEGAKFIRTLLINVAVFLVAICGTFALVRSAEMMSNLPTEVAKREYYQKMSKASKDLSPIHQQKGEKLEVLIISYKEIPVRAQYAPVALRAQTKEGGVILVFLDNESGRCNIYRIIPGNYLSVIKVSIDGQEMYFADTCPFEPRSF